MIASGVGVVTVVVVVRGEEGCQLVPREAGKGQLTQVAEHDCRLCALLFTHLWRHMR